MLAQPAPIPKERDPRLLPVQVALLLLRRPLGCRIWGRQPCEM
jgi:hypothetical protein